MADLRHVTKTTVDRLPDGRGLCPPDPRLNVTSDLALNDPDADPIQVMLNWTETIWAERGRWPDRLVMHPATFLDLLDRPKVRGVMTLFIKPVFSWSQFVADHGAVWLASTVRVPLIQSDPALWRKMIVAELDDGPGVHRAELIFKGYKVGI